MNISQRTTALDAIKWTQLAQDGSGSLAYSSVQDGLEYFSHELGFVAYKPLKFDRHSAVVLADPICAKENYKQIIEAFLKVKPDPAFLHASRDVAQVLNELGFLVNEMGVETMLDVQTFHTKGGKKEQLRRAGNGARKDGLTVAEITAIDEKTQAELQKVSEEWMKMSVVSSSDMQFIVRPLLFENEKDVRWFGAYKDGAIVGFVVFDPMYDQGAVVGYLANQLRANLDCTYSVPDFIILEAMVQFKAEGKKELSLGLSPLANVISHEELPEARHKNLPRAGK